MKEHVDSFKLVFKISFVIWDFQKYLHENERNTLKPRAQLKCINMNEFSSVSILFSFNWQTLFVEYQKVNSVVNICEFINFSSISSPAQVGLVVFHNLKCFGFLFFLLVRSTIYMTLLILGKNFEMFKKGILSLCC